MSISYEHDSIGSTRIGLAALAAMTALSFAEGCSSDSSSGGGSDAGFDGNGSAVSFWDQASPACRSLHGTYVGENWYWDTNAGAQVTDLNDTMTATFGNGVLSSFNGLVCETLSTKPPQCDLCDTVYKCGPCYVSVGTKYRLVERADWVFETASGPGWSNDAPECQAIYGKTYLLASSMSGAATCRDPLACDGITSGCKVGHLCVSGQCQAPRCGDEFCTDNETKANCPSDCGMAGGCSSCLSGCQGIPGCCTGCGCMCESACGGCL